MKLLLCLQVIADGHFKLVIKLVVCLWSWKTRGQKIVGCLEGVVNQLLIYALLVCCLQVLPQILYYFGVENDVSSLDWAAIAVYACEASCDGSVAYKEEFVWVQIASQSSTTHR